MTENRGFRSDSNFSQKWQKLRVEALKRSEIECLGFTERERETFAKLIFHLSFLLKIRLIFLFQNINLKLIFG